MEINLNYYVLRIIFQYLNGFDLHNASQVSSRSWSEIANDERRTRGPMCIIKSRDNILDSRDYEVVRKEIIECCRVKPSLSMLFINIKSKEKIVGECYCEYLPFNWYSPVLGSYLPTGDKNTILGMFFPEVPNIKISTLTLVPYKLIWGNGIYCHEIGTNFNLSFTNADRLKTVFESVFNFDLSMESCMILLCDRNGVLITSNLENALRNWFPNKRLPVWGGIVDYLSICHHMPHTPISNESMLCIAILICGMEMNTWSTFLYCNCNTQKKIERKLKYFKDNIVLKKHSIGFMFNPQFRTHLSCLESAIFKRIFPSVPLVEYSGIGAFGGIDNEPYTRIINKLNLFEKTAFMVITYN